MARSRYVIIGDGIAGATAAETLRANDDDAEITILTNEGEPLYNRVAIKEFAKGIKKEDSVKIHDQSWYEERNIDLKLFTQVSMVDDKSNVVITEGGERYEYDKLLIAAGGTPRKYPAPGSQGDGIHTFWTFPDARRIREDASNAEGAVAVGAGLLGIDLAVVFAKNGCDTKYVMRGNRWWREGINKDGSAIVEQALTDMGVECIFHETVDEFQLDENGHVKAAHTDKGNVYPAQVAGVAIGLNMNLRLAATSNVKTGEGILANQYLQTSVPNIYTAGDIAQYFDPLLNRIQINGSWASAKRQGEIAALNMLNEEEQIPFEHVDYYSISHFKFPVMSVGNVLGDEITEATPAEGVYRRMVFKENRLIGAVLIGDAKPLMHLKKIVYSRKDVSQYKNEFLKADFDFKGFAADLPPPPK